MTTTTSKQRAMHSAILDAAAICLASVDQRTGDLARCGCGAAADAVFPGGWAVMTVGRRVLCRTCARGSAAPLVELAEQLGDVRPPPALGLWVRGKPQNAWCDCLAYPASARNVEILGGTGDVVHGACVHCLREKWPALAAAVDAINGTPPAVRSPAPAPVAPPPVPARRLALCLAMTSISGFQVSDPDATEHRSLRARAEALLEAVEILICARACCEL